MTNLIKPTGEVWIIGATHGLGRALAELYWAQGRRVVGMARRAPDDSGPFDAFRTLDLASTTETETVIGSLFSEGRRLYLIVVAASALIQGSLMSRDEAGLRAEIKTNYLGFVRVCQTVARFKPADHRLRLVAVASTLGYVGCPSLETYSASKAALISFARSARSQLRPLGIDILILSPPHMENGADIKPPETRTLAWSAQKFAAAADARRCEFLLGAANRGLVRLSRLVPGVAQSIMDRIGADALARGANMRRNAPQAGASRGSLL